ncbi:Alpha/Beta hydrolase protein [Amylocarpus encephaloides]|uniref:Carboxylic ester hydrolase n=1 Tax=Amylocarpus encephaloides TaxID=45428 RepID=A0A9P8C6U3_9HELO|nr:Alpha/Beta hydrolase protein [Amylocarpus encephaloides]
MKLSWFHRLCVVTCAYATTLVGCDAQRTQRQTASNWTVGQTVQISSGAVSGHAAKNQTQVSEYLGIPFAQPPIGDLRFAPPVKYNGTAAINGSSFGPSCPGKDTLSSSTSPESIAQANITLAGISHYTTFGISSAEPDEDCLYLNVWTKPQTGESKKAVLIWIYGGGFTSGSASVPGYNGANLAVEQDVVVVSLNYRLSILGFPGNPFGTQNVALLDQRLAMEWVRDNIEKFGGDPSRITIFGQSAGAVSVDLYSYAWAVDPIVAGIIPESGTVFSWGLPNSPSFAANSWYRTAANLGCGNSTSDSGTVLSCMLSHNYTTLLDAIPATSGFAGILGLFGPTVDNKIAFGNYTGRTPAKVPVLVGNTNYEAGLFRTQFALNNMTYPDYFWDVFNLQEFTCPSGIRANASVAAHNPTWRYRYMGVWDNTELSTEADTYHGAELSFLFNIMPSEPPGSAEEIEFGKYMRGAWAAFAKDPMTGLMNYGWPSYNFATDSLVRLAYNNQTGLNVVKPELYDANCRFVNTSSTDPELVPNIPCLKDPNCFDTTATSTSTRSAGSGASPTASSTGASSSTSTNAATKASAPFSMILLGAIAISMM